MAGWLTRAEARALWRDAPADDARLDMFLVAARSAVIAYAPALEGSTAADAGSLLQTQSGSFLEVEGYGLGPYGLGAYGGGEAEDIPDEWRLAQYLQARSIANAGRVPAGDGQADGSSFGFAAYPLDWQVKQLLRPQRGMGAIA